jgi:multidrug resistance efflux pump
MNDSIRVGDRVKIRLDAKFGENEGWYEGAVFGIEPYSEHRSFYWVELDEEAQKKLRIKEISIFNPKNIAKIPRRPNP